MRSCQVIASINRNIGGPATTVPRLAQALAACGVDSNIATLNYSEHGPQTPATPAAVFSVNAGTVTRKLRGWSPGFSSELEALASQGLDVIHSHGLWMFPNYYARKAAVGAGVPLVISPRGMLEEWSLGRSRLKKSVVWRLFERANLAEAKLFHATGEPEAESLRAAGLRQPVAVIPNGIDMPDVQAAPPRTLLETKYPDLAGKSWLLFLSRLHEKKGIVELLRVWGELKERFPDWQLVLAGPDLDGYGRRAREMAAQLGLDSRVTFTGMLSGDDKSCALWNAGLFVLPTHSENFGLAVAEALAHQVPVVTTKGAPWRVLNENGCGWWIDMDERALADALDAAMRLPAAERREMGARGRSLMEQRYSWTRIGEETSAVYHWLADRGERPDCVHLA